MSDWAGRGVVAGVDAVLGLVSKACVHHATGPVVIIRAAKGG